VLKARLWKIAFLLTLLFYLVINCSNPFSSLTDLDIELTPEDYVEAELIALCLSGELVAPDDIWDQVLRDLADIRSTHGDTFGSILSIRFSPPWIVGNLIIGFDSSTAQMVANGDYNAWNQLNESYQVTEIDTRSIRYDWVLVHFKDRLHPRRLAEMYEVLPGVAYAEPNGIMGDRSNIYPRQTFRGITYLFREGWGDCPSGCIYNIYWYFVIEWNRPTFFGQWNPQENPREPDWWNEAKQNIDLYHKW
jgi:hypothetical protein